MPQDQIESSKALWVAVFFQAIQDLIKPKGNASDKVRFRESSTAWFNDLENDEINSFIGICGMLEIDPDRTRKAIFAMKKRKNFIVSGCFLPSQADEGDQAP